MIFLTRPQYDDLLAQRDNAIATLHSMQERYEELVKELLVFKRHELGMAANGVDHTPVTLTGPLTELAVEEFAAGDPELRRFLLARAMAEAGVRKATGAEDSEIDRQVAALISAGDE